MPTEAPQRYTYTCPECDHEIDRLDYNVETNELGTMLWGEDSANADEIRDRSEHNCDDNEWVGDVVYRCPECETEINLDSIIITPIGSRESDEEENEEVSGKVEQTYDSLDLSEDSSVSNKTNVVQKIQCNFTSNENFKEGLCVTCPKCKHDILVDRNEVLEECPNCGKTMPKPKQPN